jgi:aquaporin NIP
MNGTMRKRVAAETLGTFLMVFAGTAAIAANRDGAVSHVGVSATFGLVVFAMIATIGDVSGAHMNPAVTLGFVAARRFPMREALAYFAAQFGGAILASLFVRALFPNDEFIGATRPAGTLAQAAGVEIALTFALMFVILGVSVGAKEKGVTAGLAIGATVMLGALFGGPLTGASMNPARSLGPALVSGKLDDLWLYFAAPVIGALLAVGACRCVRDEPCCAARDAAGACG